MSKYNIPLKISVIYAVVCVIWEFSLHCFHLYFPSLGVGRGYLFVVITSVMIYLLIMGEVRRRNVIEGKLREKYEELSTVHEQLADVEEELRTRVEHLAYYDYLTRLPNRLMFMNKLKDELDKSFINKTKGAVLFLDLDDFKRINDTLGHDYGDMLIKIVSNNLKNCVSDKDFIARFGGDEFLILLSQVDSHKEVVEAAKNILKNFNNKFELGEKQVYITASIGIIMYPADGDDVNSIIKNVDTAMYKAKSLGKNRYCFFDKILSSNLFRKTEIEKGLRSALEKGELSLHYQPQIDLKTVRIKGVEALLRWNSEELGFVPPNEFIPIAEETGLINSITLWIIKTACLQNRHWKDKGYKFDAVSINISSVQLKDEEFVSLVKNILEETNTEAETLQFEITESILMESIDKNMNALEELKSLGIKIALDDFGTGYSSLNYLRALPIDTVKIDKSFINEISSDLEARAITDGIINLAHKIKLDVVVEGVEDVEQVNLLRDMNCNVIQGYYFYKPLPAEEIGKIMSY